MRDARIIIDDAVFCILENDGEDEYVEEYVQPFIRPVRKYKVLECPVCNDDAEVHEIIHPGLNLGNRIGYRIVCPYCGLRTRTVLTNDDEDLVTLINEWNGILRRERKGKPVG